MDVKSLLLKQSPEYKDQSIDHIEYINWDKHSWHDEKPILDKEFAYRYQTIIFNKNCAVTINPFQAGLKLMLLEKLYRMPKLYIIESDIWFRIYQIIYINTIDTIKPDEFYLLLLENAIMLSGSDIHVVSYKGNLKYGIRVSGILKLEEKKSRQLSDSFFIYIKAIANVDIISDQFQIDGKNIQMKILGGKYSLRVSIIKTFNGYSIVTRLFSNIEKLDATKFFDSNYLSFIQNYFNKKQGIGIIAGSTGSGKSTTLYSLLKQNNTRISIT